MKTNILIATSKYPRQNKWDQFKADIQAGCPKQINKFELRSGPGCVNFAMEIEGELDEELEDFASSLSLALMPSRWTVTDSEVIDGYFLSDDLK